MIIDIIVNVIINIQHHHQDYHLHELDHQYDHQHDDPTDVITTMVTSMNMIMYMTTNKFTNMNVITNMITSGPLATTFSSPLICSPPFCKACKKNFCNARLQCWSFCNACKANAQAFAMPVMLKFLQRLHASAWSNHHQNDNQRNHHRDHHCDHHRRLHFDHHRRHHCDHQPTCAMMVATLSLSTPWLTLLFFRWCGVSRLRFTVMNITILSTIVSSEIHSHDNHYWLPHFITAELYEGQIDDTFENTNWCQGYIAYFLVSWFVQAKI